MNNSDNAVVSTFSETKVMSIKDRLIGMIHNNPDLPTLGSAISNVIELTSSDGKSLEQLTNLIVSDPSLTLKILRLSNSITYRTTVPAVTSVSKAIQLLGMNTIKACALAMILVEGMPRKHARTVRYELMRSLSASLIGRNLAKRSAFPNAEEVAIAALFKNMGRLILAAFDDDLYNETMAFVSEDEQSEARVSMRMLGCTFSWLTEFALREWHIPDPIIYAMKTLPGRALKPAKNRGEWMQQVAEFSECAALLALQGDQSSDSSLRQNLLDRFGEALNLEAPQLEALLQESSEQARTICSYALNLRVDEHTEGVIAKIGHETDKIDSKYNLIDHLWFNVINRDHKRAEISQSNCKPSNTLDQLLTGVQDVSEILASGQYSLSTLFMMVLETFYRSLDFQFATVCLWDIRTNQFRSRYSLGLNHDKIQKGFVFPVTESADLFSMAIKRNVDLSISDAADTKIRNALPSWHTQLLPDTRSFMILPLVVRNKPIGLFYADRSTTATEGITINEMKLIKALKGQILVALNS